MDALDTSIHIPRGLTARIAGFHPAGPGSTPGVGNMFLCFKWWENKVFHGRNLWCDRNRFNMPKIIVKYNEYELDLDGNIQHN